MKLMTNLVAGPALISTGSKTSFSNHVKFPEVRIDPEERFYRTNSETSGDGGEAGLLCNLSQTATLLYQTIASRLLPELPRHVILPFMLSDHA